MLKQIRKRKRRLKKCTSFVICFLFFAGLMLIVFEKKVFASIEEISYARSKTIANAIIDRSIERVLGNFSPDSDAYIITVQGDYNNYTANTPLITAFCTQLSQELNLSMENIGNERIEIPLGVVTNMHYFANKGPKILFTLMPASATTVDYETAFTSSGINQINYKIWINISVDVQIVNPLHKEKVALNRKVMLVDTVIGGRVPDHYFSIGQQ